LPLDFKAIEQEAFKSKERLQELQKVLAGISSIRNKGGDIFFHGLSKIFQA
jgi:hypothetical protein